MSHEPAWSVFINETREFLGRERSQDDDQPSSARKFCPTCRHVYRDVTLNFCLDDGSVLSLASDSPQDTPEATKILPNPVDKESA
jgi:hypothetical protein